MCRHLLPRFDVTLGHALHQGAEWIGTHPSLAAMAGVACSLVAIGTSIYPAARRPSAMRRSHDARRLLSDGWAPLPTQPLGRG